MDPLTAIIEPKTNNVTSILLTCVACIVFILLVFIFCVIRNLKQENDELVEITQDPDLLKKEEPN